MKNLSLIMAFLAMAAYSMSFSQTVLKGKVIDEELGSPIPSAKVSEKGTQNITRTDLDGNFELTTENETGEIVISVWSERP